jgi:hypothetical protein
MTRVQAQGQITIRQRDCAPQVSGPLSRDRVIGPQRDTVAAHALAKCHLS